MISVEVCALPVTIDRVAELEIVVAHWAFSDHFLLLSEQNLDIILLQDVQPMLSMC